MITTESVTVNQIAETKDGKVQHSYRTLWGLVDAPVRFHVAVMFLLFHVGALVTLFTFPFAEKWKTTVWLLFIAFLSIFGLTAGAHRLFTHRAYKVNMPVKIFLTMVYHMNGQMSLYNWVRTHIVHHKYSDTDVDPHNINRGFVFAHFGWFMMDKHPAYLEQGRKHDYGDALDDPILIFTKKHYYLLNTLFCYVIPIAVPMYFWEETFYWAVMANMLRFVISVHPSLSINSFAHLYGSRPYDNSQRAGENVLLSLISHGEGWHNYHHVFPWDYKAGELGTYRTNFTTFLIDALAKMGWAYDLRSPSPALIKKYVLEKGDGTHYFWGKEEVEDTELKNSKME